MKRIKILVTEKLAVGATNNKFNPCITTQAKPNSSQEQKQHGI